MSDVLQVVGRRYQLLNPNDERTLDLAIARLQRPCPSSISTARGVAALGGDREGSQEIDSDPQEPKQSEHLGHERCR